MVNKNAYTWAGLGLLIAGGLVSVAAYFILNVIWLTALGLCMLILAAVLLALGRTIPRLSPELARLLLDTGTDNIASIVEELGIRSSAMYLPSSLAGGRPRALIPLDSAKSLPQINKKLPRRLIARYGDGPDDIGLLLSTIGSSAAGMLESKPLPTPEGLGAALTTIFSGLLGVADGVNVSEQEGSLVVEIRNPRFENQATLSDRSFGGPLASIVASVAAEAWDKPVTIKQEARHNRSYTVEIEVLREGL